MKVTCFPEISSFAKADGASDLLEGSVSCKDCSQSITSTNSCDLGGGGWLHVWICFGGLLHRGVPDRCIQVGEIAKRLWPFGG